MNLTSGLESCIATLLESVRPQARITSIVSCAQGGNNRIYRVATSEGFFAAKSYFTHSEDRRDRLRTEYEFLIYSAKVAPGVAPAPLAMQQDIGLALYEFVNGEPISSLELDWPKVQQAIKYFALLNDPQGRSTAQGLKPASEACFSILEHLDVVGRRLDVLNQMQSQDSAAVSALKLVEKLKRRWLTIVEEVQDEAKREGIDPRSPLNSKQMCISPSDFGFHNALQLQNGSIRFLDFEYAGWDDPAKMTGDFFSQLAVPIPEVYFTQFGNEVMSNFPAPDEMVFRAHLLKRVYKVKWCCIALNVFLPVHLARRKYADPKLNEVALKQLQLSKAQTLLSALEI